LGRGFGGEGLGLGRGFGGEGLGLGRGGGGEGLGLGRGGEGDGLGPGLLFSQSPLPLLALGFHLHCLLQLLNISSQLFGPYVLHSVFVLQLAKKDGKFPI
jgi:hypothetical protein